MNKRLSGHWIRADVVKSGLRVGIKHSDWRLSLWAAALLLRQKGPNQWRSVVQQITETICDCTDSTTRPGLYSALKPLCVALARHLSKKGVSKNTPSCRRILFRLLAVAIQSPKNKTCMVARHYGYITAKTNPPPRTLQECSVEFQTALRSSNWHRCCMWACLVDTLWPESGLESLWPHVLRGNKTAETKTMWELCHLVKADGRVLFPSLPLLVEACRPRQDSQNKNETDSASDDPKIPKQFEKFWASLFSKPVVPQVRKLVEWDRWLGIVCDCSTAAGRGHNTVNDLRRQNQCITDDLVAPDCVGFSRPSQVLHTWQVVDIAACDADVGALEDIVKNFYWNEERLYGQSGLTTLKRLRKSIQEDHKRSTIQAAPKMDQKDIDVLVRRARQTRTLTPAPKANVAKRKDLSRSSSSVSLYCTPRKSFVSHGGCVTSSSGGKAMLQLPGMHRDHSDGERNHGPPSIEGCRVARCQMTGPPTPGQFCPPSWIAVLDDGRSLWIKECSEMDATVAVYLDRAKTTLGLPSQGLRWWGGWLVGDDVGSGGPYREVERGHKKWKVVDPEATGLRAVEDALVDSLSIAKWTLFRALFNVLDKKNKLVWSESTGLLYSFGDCALCNDLGQQQQQDEKKQSVLTDILHEVEQESVDVSVDVTALRALLCGWQSKVFDVRAPPRPVAGMRSAQEMYNCLIGWQRHL